MGYGVRGYLLGGAMTRKTILDLLSLLAEFTNAANSTLNDMGKHDRILSGTKHSGQLRRLSMDITRKLAELRAGK